MKRLFLWTTAIAAWSVCGICARVSSAAIYSNPITDANPSTANPFTAGEVLDASITASGIGRGSGVNANAGSNRYNATAWSFPDLGTDDYFSWTLTPNANFEMNFTTLSGNWQRSGTGPKTYDLRSSLDSFGTSLANGTITGSGSAAAYSVDLSAIPTMQHVATAIEFRLFAFGGTAAAGTFSINDFTFDGTVASTTSTPTTLAGDYNGDHNVDAADYTVWSDNIGATSLTNETASLNIVDSNDFDAWKNNFGASDLGSGGLATAAQVPEPSTALLALAAFVFVVERTVRRAKHWVRNG
jgi:hypothetical protein